MSLAHPKLEAQGRVKSGQQRLQDAALREDTMEKEDIPRHRASSTVFLLLSYKTRMENDQGVTRVISDLNRHLVGC